jgi:hypothetical protein
MGMSTHPPATTFSLYCDDREYDNRSAIADKGLWGPCEFQY